MLAAITVTISGFLMLCPMKRMIPAAVPQLPRLLGPVVPRRLGGFPSTRVYPACLRWRTVAQQFATCEHLPTLWGLAGSCLAQQTAHPTTRLPLVVLGFVPALGLNLEPHPWLKLSSNISFSENQQCSQPSFRLPYSDQQLSGSSKATAASSYKGAAL